jgi:hypothetical protein
MGNTYYERVVARPIQLTEEDETMIHGLLTEEMPRTKLIPKQRPAPRPTTERARAKAIVVEARAQRDEWPKVADPAEDKLIPGHIAYIRTRWGAIKHYRIRLVLRSKSWFNSGRVYFIGTDRKGLCHRVWSDQLVSTQTVQQAITAGRAVRAIGR